MPDSIVITRPEPGIAVIRLSRPERLNAMTAELVQGLHDALEELDADETVRVIILTGEGRAFCAGLDLTGYGIPPDPPSDRSDATGMALATQKHIASLITHLRHTRQPIIAAVNGAAAGGGLALVLGSDIRIAAKSARFSAAFVKIGVSGCDIGTSWLLPRLVGAGHAHEMMLTGRNVESDEAARLGLVVDVVGDEELMERCLNEARLVLANSPMGVRMTKETMWASLETPGVEAAIILENHTQVMCLSADDHREAVTAFLEKRPPRWAPVE